MVHERMGRRAEAREHLAQAVTMFRQLDMRSWLEKATAAVDLAANVL